MSNKKFNFSMINAVRLLRTVRGSIKKSFFYLDARVPYKYADDLATLSALDINDYISGDGQKIKKLMEVDAKIRYYDDILDNQLAKQNPLPVKKMRG